MSQNNFTLGTFSLQSLQCQTSISTFQIREMTQSDVIYEQKEQFKEDNKSRLRRSATIEDKRWSKLEGSLCRTHGVSRKWRQLCPAGPWVQVKDMH